MSSITLEQIEDGILTTLRGDALLQQMCRTIAPFHGDVEEEIGYTPTLFPAIFVMFLDSEFLPLTNTRSQEGDFIFSLIVATQSTLGNEFARRGGAGVAGTYQLMQRIRVVLRGSDLGIPHIPHTQLVRQTALRNTKAMSIYDLQYVIRQVTIKLGE